jgi:hypothetical protein
MKKFWNQHHHGVLNRYQAMEQLSKISGYLATQHEIPPTPKAADAQGQDYETESDAESEFEEILEAHSFPPPRRQYSVDLGNGETTVADFAYEKDDGKAVLIYVDGTSDSLHGNPSQKRKDALLRAKARMQRHDVVETTADALEDETNVSYVLQEIKLYLDSYG